MFSWVVSDFGLTDAIESGIVKIPQLAVSDPSDDESRTHYLFLWESTTSIRGAQCTINVTFRPTVGVRRHGQVTIASDSAAGPAAATLFGVGAPPGDLDSDCAVNASDMQRVINATLGVTPNPDADLNGDGAVTQAGWTSRSPPS
jgi:hypothetical protein